MDFMRLLLDGGRRKLNAGNGDWVLFPERGICYNIGHGKEFDF